MELILGANQKLAGENPSFCPGGNALLSKIILTVLRIFFIYLFEYQKR
jgi:hypothetical protein